MIRHNEIWSASLKYADEHPSDYTNEMFDIVDIEKAFGAGAEWVDKTAWKPTSAQMEALDSAIDEFDGYPEFGSLVSLKEDLEKLKEE